MNWTRNIRSLYRREPITGFMLTAGLVDAFIGGTGGYQMLLAIGLGTTGLAIGMRWKLMQQTRRESMQPQNQPQSKHQSKYQERRSRFLPDSDAHLVTIDVDARKV
ncbi:hypothetical protein [Leptolyngbya ohadii]|uniref:hypothetical protein n=1 Tax=Leptolyngbya ohadii TaxID=1962290 RepID=UPI000B59F8A8|nr:hypothetical protein [Leptolyngbya ohadii]